MLHVFGHFCTQELIRQGALVPFTGGGVVNVWHLVQQVTSYIHQAASRLYKPSCGFHSSVQLTVSDAASCATHVPVYAVLSFNKC